MMNADNWDFKWKSSGCSETFEWIIMPIVKNYFKKPQRVEKRHQKDDTILKHLEWKKAKKSHRHTQKKEPNIL